MHFPTDDLLTVGNRKGIVEGETGLSIDEKRRRGLVISCRAFHIGASKAEAP